MSSLWCCDRVGIQSLPGLLLWHRTDFAQVHGFAWRCLAARSAAEHQPHRSKVYLTRVIRRWRSLDDCIHRVFRTTWIFACRRASRIFGRYLVLICPTASRTVFRSGIIPSAISFSACVRKSDGLYSARLCQPRFHGCTRLNAVHNIMTPNVIEIPNTNAGQHDITPPPIHRFEFRERCQR